MWLAVLPIYKHLTVLFFLQVHTYLIRVAQKGIQMVVLKSLVKPAPPMVLQTRMTLMEEPLAMSRRMNVSHTTAVMSGYRL